MYPTIQGNIKYQETAVNLINNVLEQGPPRTLGVFVEGADGAVGRAVFRTKDLLYFRGTKGDLLTEISKEMGDDFVKGLTEANAIIRYAQSKGLKGAMVDEEMLLSIVADPTEAALHYHEMAKELVQYTHGRTADREFILSADDIVAEALYQAGIPAREVRNMAEYAMNRKAFQLRDIIDDDFAPDVVGEMWEVCWMRCTSLMKVGTGPCVMVRGELGCSPTGRMGFLPI